MPGITLMDIKNGDSGVNILLVIVKKDPIREITLKKSGEKTRVADCHIEDEAGNKGYLSLWRDQVDKFNEGDKVELKMGYAHLYDGNVNLSSGKTGELVKCSTE